MAELMENVTRQYDVFMVHSSEDASKVQIIRKGLQEKGLTTFAHFKEGAAFVIGRPVFDNIVHAIKYSNVVLVLITKHAITSRWVTLETLMALEKSCRDDVMRVRLLFEGFSESARQTFKSGALKLIPDIVVDFNKDNWKDDLTLKIKAISTTVKTSQYFQPDNFSRKFFIVIPASCQISPLEVIYDNYIIERMEHPLEMEVAYGDKLRKYNPAIYKISKDDEFFYFSADCPFIIATMFKIKQMGFADIDVRFQGNRFYMTLKELVDHRNSLDCHDTANIILHHETSPAIEIWKSLRAEFSVPTKSKASTANIVRRRGRFDKGERKLLVTVTYSAEADCSDLCVADDVITFLTSNNVKFSEDEAEMHKGDSEKQLYIFVLSETSVKNKRMVLEFRTALSKSTKTTQLQVIPVLTKGTDMNSIPSLFKWTTFLKQEDPLYLEKMWKAMLEYKQIEEALQAGSLFEGLAYSYTINYLSYNLTGKTAEGRDFRERFVDAVSKYNVQCKLVPRVYVIVPSSCSLPAPGTQFDHEEHLGQVEPIVEGIRKYFLQVYVLTITRPGKWNGEKVCYAREYATPAIALREMTQMPFAGLSRQEMTTQAKEFAAFSNEIMQHDIYSRKIGDVRNKCSILYFEDDIHGMAGVTRLLEEQIIQCLDEGQFIEPP